MIVLAVLLACAEAPDDGGAHPSPPDTGPPPDCDAYLPDPAIVVDAAAAARLEVRGEPYAQLGTAVACTADPVGAFASGAVAVGGPEIDNEAGDYGWVAVLPADHAGVVSVEQAPMVVRGTDHRDLLGFDVAFPGDLDGDGTGEFLATALSAWRPERETGGAFLFDVASGSFAPEDAAVHFLGQARGYLATVAPAGDLDGDGLPDVVLGHMALSQPVPGFLAVHLGGLLAPEVLPEEAAATYPALDATQPTGWTMAIADLDGDGHNDLIHGEFNHQYLISAGRVTVLSGPLIGGPPRTLEDTTSVLEGEGDGDDDAAGGHLATGDLDGDGQTDLVVSAHTLDGPAGERSGRAYVFFGPLAPGTRSLAEADVIIDADEPFTFLGNGLVVLDHDGDGQDDLAVAAPVDPYFGPACPGAVYVLRGPLVPGVIQLRADAAVAYVDDGPWAGFGRAMAACDLDGDGDDELVLGSPWAKLDTDPPSLAGRMQVVDGGPWPAAARRSVRRGSQEGRAAGP